MQKDLKEIAAKCLAYNSHLDKIHVTADGQCFPLRNDAVNHAVKLQDNTVQIFDRSGEVSSENNGNTENAPKYPFNVKDTVALILKAESEEGINSIIEGDDRKTVLDAANKQIAILKQKAIDAQNAAADAALQQRTEQTPVDTAGTQDQILGDQNPVSVVPPAPAAPAPAKQPVASKPKAPAKPKAETTKASK